MIPKSRGSHADTNQPVHITEAKHYALKLLSYRFRSRKEMLERLKRKGFDDTEIHSTIEYLQNAGLIKDETLAPNLLAHAITKKHLGKKGIRAFLAKHGIEKDLINETLAGLSEDMEKGAALMLAEKKMRVLKKYPQDTIRQRLWRTLERKGFSADVIHKTIKAIGSYPGT